VFKLNAKLKKNMSLLEFNCLHSVVPVKALEELEYSISHPFQPPITLEDFRKKAMDGYSKTEYFLCNPNKFKTDELVKLKINTWIDVQYDAYLIRKEHKKELSCLHSLYFILTFLKIIFQY
jgi:hypothetical protein